MKHSSLRGNLLWLAGIYLVSLVVASGCPTNEAGPTKPTALPASINPPETPVVETQPASEPPAMAEAVAVVPAPVPAEPVAQPSEKEPARLPNDANEPQTSILIKGVVEEKTLGKPVDDGGDPNEFFKDWQKPQLALVITGEQNGYMEPCGCSGLENQKGGIGRRHDMIQQLKAKGWPVACVDVGGLVGRFGKQAELKFDASAQALRTMGYQAAGFGAEDLRLESGVVGVTAAPGMFTSSNVDVLTLVPVVRTFDVGEFKIGVISVLGDALQKLVINPDLKFKAAAEGIAEALPQLDKCNLRILLSNAKVQESEELAKKFPEFNVVVTGGTTGEPMNRLKEVDGRPFIETGDKGMYAIVLGFYPDKKKPSYQRVALDKRYHVTPEMKQIMADLQNHYENLGLTGLTGQPRAHLQANNNDPKSGQFVGSANCRSCHAEAYDVWKKTGHAHATDTLAKLDPPRMFDPECLSCHVTGWNPQEFYPYLSGYLGLKETPHLVSNGCENCHGPGAAHVAAETDGTPETQMPLRQLMHIPHEKAEKKCKECHDRDNSPKFNEPGGFEEYWKKIAH